MGNTKQNRYLHRNNKSHKMNKCEYCGKPSGKHSECKQCEKEQKEFWRNSEISNEQLEADRFLDSRDNYLGKRSKITGL